MFFNLNTLRYRVKLGTEIDFTGYIGLDLAQINIFKINCILCFALHLKGDLSISRSFYIKGGAVLFQF